MIRGNRQHRPEQTRAGRSKPESQRPGDEQIERRGQQAGVPRRQWHRARDGLPALNRLRTGGRRWDFCGIAVPHRVGFFDAPDNEVRVEAHRCGVRARVCASEDAAGPSREIVCLESLEDGYRQLRLI